MSQTFIALSFWLHALGTVILVGHYLLLSLIYLPIFMKNQADSASATILSQISKRSRVWLYISMLIFAITGVYLTFVDPNYLGIGHFDNTWAILMLSKHILILGMLGMGFWFNAIMRVGPMLVSKTGATRGLTHFRRYTYLMALSGVLVLLLTAISQTQ